MYDILSPANTGRVISVWSPVSRQGTVSTIASMLTAYIGYANPEDKVLLLSNNTNGTPTADFYLTNEHTINGLAEIIELSISDNLRKPDDLYNNAHSISRNIDTLTCEKGNTNVADFLDRELNKIIDLAKKSYKYIIIDTVPGDFDRTTEDILKASDCVVIGCPQDKYIFDNFVRKMPDVYPQVLRNKIQVVVVSSYYDYDHFRYVDMQKEMKGQPLFYINQNSAVHKANSERKMLDFITSEMQLKRGRDEVIDEIEAIYNRINTIIEYIVEKEVEMEAENADKNQQFNREYMQERYIVNNEATEISSQEDAMSDLEFGGDGFSDFEDGSASGSGSGSSSEDDLYSSDSQ